MTEIAATFDYEAPENINHMVVLSRATEVIHKEMGRCAKSIITIGLHLIEAKEECGKGKFLKWIAMEFGWSDQTARRFMHVAMRFGEDPTRVLSLEPTTLYLLAAPNTPEPIRKDILDRFDAGEKLQIKEIKSLIEKTKGKIGGIEDGGYKSLLAAWDRATDEARTKFCELLSLREAA